MVVIGPQVLKPVAALAVSVIATSTLLIVSANGQPVGKVDLLAPPTHLVLVADPHRAPGVVADLYLSLTTQ